MTDKYYFVYIWKGEIIFGLKIPNLFLKLAFALPHVCTILKQIFLGLKDLPDQLDVVLHQFHDFFCCRKWILSSHLFLCWCSQWSVLHKRHKHANQIGELHINILKRFRGVRVYCRVPGSKGRQLACWV